MTSDKYAIGILTIVTIIHNVKRYINKKIRMAKTHKASYCHPNSIDINEMANYMDSGTRNFPRKPFGDAFIQPKKMFICFSVRKAWSS